MAPIGAQERILRRVRQSLHPWLHFSKRYAQGMKELTRVELADKDRNARLDDACLFECDLRQGRPQVQLMIERNRRDGGHCGRHDVGCIESPSQPHLAHRDVYLSSTKELECDGGRGFKERRGRIQNAPSEQPLHGFPKRADRRHQVCLFDAASLDDESFGQIHQVR